MRSLYIKWALLMVKRNIERPSFWILAIITAFIFQITSYVAVEYTKTVTVPIVNEGGTVGEKVCEELVKNRFDGIEFVMCEDSKSAEMMVIQSKAPCSFVFTEKLSEITLKSRKNDAIVMYQSSSALSGYMIKELVFSTVLKTLAPKYFEEYLNRINTDEEAKTSVIVGFDTYLNEKNINIFEVKVLGESSVMEEDSSYEQNFVIQIAVIIVFLTELFAVFYSARKTDRFFLGKFSKSKSVILSMEHAAISASMILIIAFLFYKSLTLFA